MSSFLHGPSSSKPSPPSSNEAPTAPQISPQANAQVTQPEPQRLAPRQLQTSDGLKIPSCDEFLRIGSASGIPVDREFGPTLGDLTKLDFDTLNAAAESCDIRYRGTPRASSYFYLAAKNIRAAAAFKIQRTAARERAQEVIDSGWAFLRSISESVERLPITSASRSRLEEIRRDLNSKPWPDNADIYTEDYKLLRNKYANTRNALQITVNERIEEATALESAERRDAFLSTANDAVVKHAIELRALNIPSRVLDGVIYLEDKAPPTKFMTLRQWAALILDQGNATLGAVSRDSEYGLTLKRPGERTLIIIFRADGGDLFVDGIESAGFVELVTSVLAKTQIAQLLRNLVSAP
jgi:hypothetical protein